MIQIESLIIYGKNGKHRVLPFNIGKVSLIVGKSKTGKSAIGDIIDYCMGSSECNIAEGVIRENVSWYALLLKTDAETLLIARKNPSPSNSSNQQVRYSVGVTEIPENVDNMASLSFAEFKTFLNNKIGIGENIHTPLKGQTRRPLSATVRHSLFYCIQNQDEITSQKFIFHNQSKEYVAQSIKDTISYFLGIVNEKEMDLIHEKENLVKELNDLKKNLDEINNIKGDGQRAIGLLAEAVEVGLLSKEEANLETLKIEDVLKEIHEKKQNNSLFINPESTNLPSLQKRMKSKQIEMNNVKIEIMNLEEFFSEFVDYESELKYQEHRLKTVNLFNKADNQDCCPLCSSKIIDSHPTFDQIKESANRLERILSSSGREKPTLRKHIEELASKENSLRKEINNLKIKINSIYEENKRASECSDENARVARVIGRISLWVESTVPPTSDKNNINQKIEILERRLEEIDNLLDVSVLNEKREFVLSKLTNWMTDWARNLELEHSEYPFRLDLNKMTVVYDKDRPIRLEEMGSAYNWLGCHLITLLSLHKHFVIEKRPVPRFLFFDQPSQVCFPSDSCEYDLESVKKVFNFIFERVSELEGKMQVIIVEHADLEETWYKEAIIEKWQDSGALIPEDWITKEELFPEY